MKPLRLTDKEKEVVSLLIKGETNKEIAESIGISLPTVKMHMTSILEKAQVTNRTAAALKIQKKAYGKRIKLLNERIAELETTVDEWERERNRRINETGSCPGCTRWSEN